MAMRRELDALGFGGSAALMAVTMLPDGGPLGDVGYAFSNIFYSPLGVAAWGVVGWLADETLGVLMPRTTRASLFRRARWAAGTWLGSVACSLLGNRGGWLGADIAVPLHITLGVGSYVLVGAGVYALARSCWPDAVDSMTTQLHATVVRTGRELGGAWQQARQLEAQRTLHLTASAGVAPQRQPVRAATVTPQPFSRTRPIPPTQSARPVRSYAPAEVIDVVAEVVDSSPAVARYATAATYRVPSVSVLSTQPPAAAPEAHELQRTRNKIGVVLSEHGIGFAPNKAPRIGPVVVTFTVQLESGVQFSKLASRQDEIGHELGVPVRVSGSTVEVPRTDRQTVALRSLMERGFSALHLPVALGVSTTGESVSLDLAKAPHVLVAGETGSGKSVSVNVMLVSLLLSQSPSQLRLLLVDPKRVELSAYRDIPHMLAPVATETSDAVAVLQLAVGEMERRYTLLEQARARDISALGLPRIVLVVDEFADLVSQAPEAMPLTQRLVQKARAAGIHCILATQHPVKKVIDTVIKANVPTRICCRVGSEVASRLVLGEECSDATSLLGNGDSLVILPTNPKPVRVHGAFVSDADVAAVCDAWRAQGGPRYAEVQAHAEDEHETAHESVSASAKRDDLYALACAHGRESGVMSVRAIMRACSCGYDAAASLYARMEDEGLLGAPKGKARTFLG